jgi:hypothetical protein
MKFLSKFDQGEPFHPGELRLYAPGYWQYLRGNVQLYSSWRSGFISTLCLVSPLLNTIRFYHKRHLHQRLSFADPNTGKELSPLETNALLNRGDERRKP